jgi:hypothetical protein
MRIICAEFYDSISITITTHGRIDHWSETLKRHEKSNLRQRVKSSRSHRSAACIIGIDEPHNFVAVVGPRDNSTRIDQRLIASKILTWVSTNRATAKFRNLYCFICLLHESRQVVHLKVTEHPTAAWTAQQITAPHSPWQKR